MNKRQKKRVTLSFPAPPAKEKKRRYGAWWQGSGTMWAMHSKAAAWDKCIGGGGPMHSGTRNAESTWAMHSKAAAWDKCRGGRAMHSGTRNAKSTETKIFV